MVYFDAAEENAPGMDAFASGLYNHVTKVSNNIPSMFLLSPDKEVIAYIDYEQVDQAEPESRTVLQIFEWSAGVERTVARADRMAARGRYVEALREIDEIAEQDAKVSHLIQTMLGRADADSDMPETPVRPMFAGLHEEKLAEYEALAQAELDQAKALIAEEDYRGAQRILRGMVRGPESFATTAEAQTLLEEVVAKLRGN
ncbi:MAG: hypothetical protein ACIAXF_07745 [Phycisphaerales bacterium JB063]